MRLTPERLAEVRRYAQHCDVMPMLEELAGHIAALEAELAALRAERQRDYDALMRYPQSAMTLTSERK